MLRAGKYIAVLGLCLAAVSAAAGALAARQYGSQAYQASAVAATLVWVVGSLALAIVGVPRTGAGRLNASLLAMLIRMTVPMAVVLYLTRTNHPLMAFGLGGLVVVHYLAGLAIETYLCVRIVAGAETNRPSSAAITSTDTGVAGVVT